MVMATVAPRPWTRSDLERLPDDGNRYEVLDGALLVTPQAAVTHQWLASRLIELLGPYCAQHSIGVAVGPGAVIWAESELQPDVQVIPCAPSELRRDWSEVPLPLLVVEVASDSTVRRDIGIKRNAYMRLGIPEYWMIDGNARSATVVKPDTADVVVRDFLRWAPRDDVAPLVIDIGGIFAQLE